MPVVQKKDPWAIPPIANPLDVTFGDAMTEGATAYAQDYGATPTFASKLGNLLSGALQLYPPVAGAGAIHDAATTNSPQSMWDLTSAAMSAVNPLNKVQKMVNAADPGYQPGPAKTTTPEPLAMSATPQEPVKLDVSPMAETLAAAVEQPKVTGLGHASPHSFDKFEWSPKTRSTGEGAQAFGDGLYFAENPRVLDENYIPKFSKLKMQIDSPSGKIHPTVSEHRPTKFLADSLDEARGDFDDAIDNLNAQAEVYRKKARDNPGFLQADYEEYAKQFEDAVALSETWRRGEGGFSMEHKPANTYEVELLADPNKFLDFDAPLSQQRHVWDNLPQDVRDAIDDAMDRRGDNGFSDALEDYTGKDLYQALKHEDVHDVLPEEVGNSSWMTGDTTPARHTSQYLHSLGVPGIKFRDAYSRKGEPTVLIDGKAVTKKNTSGLNATEEMAVNMLRDNDPELALKTLDEYIAARPHEAETYQAVKDLISGGRVTSMKDSRNWVVFSDDIIKIVKKNGVAAALAAGVITDTEAEELYAQGYT